MLDEYYVWEGQSIEYNLQITKEVLLTNLFNNGHISKEVYDDYMLNYALQVKRPSFWNKFWKRLKGFEDDKPIVVLVKQCTLERDEVNESNTRDKNDYVKSS
jgi:hypothetical protein